MIMNIYQLNENIKNIASSITTVNSVFSGDVYENWGNGEIKYGSVNVGIENVSYEGNLTTYSIILYYGDRMLQDGSNEYQIYTDAINTLQSIINVLNEFSLVDISIPVQYTPFQQQFADYLAGMYCRVDVMTDSPIGKCAMDEYDTDKTINITKNGEYIVADYDYALVDVKDDIKPSDFLIPQYSGFAKDWLNKTIDEANRDYQNFVLGDSALHQDYKGFEVPDCDYSIRRNNTTSSLFRYAPNLLTWTADFSGINSPSVISGTYPFSYFPNMRELNLNFNKSLTYSGMYCFCHCALLEKLTLTNLTVNAMSYWFRNVPNLHTIDFGDGITILNGVNATVVLDAGYDNLKTINGVIKFAGYNFNMSGSRVLETVWVDADFSNSTQTTNTFTIAGNIRRECLLYLIEHISRPQPRATTATFNIGQNNLAKLTEEEIAIVTNKGWTVR